MNLDYYRLDLKIWIVCLSLPTSTGFTLKHKGTMKHVCCIIKNCSKQLQVQEIQDKLNFQYLLSLLDSWLFMVPWS